MILHEVSEATRGGHEHGGGCRRSESLDIDVDVCSSDYASARDGALMALCEVDEFRLNLLGELAGGADA